MRRRDRLGARSRASPWISEGIRRTKNSRISPPRHPRFSTGCSARCGNNNSLQRRAGPKCLAPAAYSLQPAKGRGGFAQLSGGDDDGGRRRKRVLIARPRVPATGPAPGGRGRRHSGSTPGGPSATIFAWRDGFRRGWQPPGGRRGAVAPARPPKANSYPPKFLSPSVATFGSTGWLGPENRCRAWRRR
jgi:hypothetical protein